MEKRLRVIGVSLLQGYTCQYYLLKSNTHPFSNRILDNISLELHPEGDVFIQGGVKVDLQLFV